MRADELNPDITYYTCIVPLTPVQIPLTQFRGIDPATITEITITPDTPSGALFLADIEFVR